MYLYHRTRKNNAQKIMRQGFRITSGNRKRKRNGLGVYTVSNLMDANLDYLKKHYGNVIVRIEVSENISFNKCTHAEALEATKQGVVLNNMYPCPDHGHVVVLCDLEGIVGLSYSTDNGNTWKV